MTQQILAREMVNEFDINGPSQRFDALNRAFSGFPVLQIEGGHCQGYSRMPCAGETDDDQAFCESCRESIDLDALKQQNQEYWREYCEMKDAQSQYQHLRI